MRHRRGGGAAPFEERLEEALAELAEPLTEPASPASEVEVN